MRILLSIKPEFADKILSGEKCFEFRKVIPRNKGIHTVVIYATMPVGKIIGEFQIDSIISEPPTKLWKITQDGAGINQIFFDQYFKNREMGHAIKIKFYKRYDMPIMLTEVLKNGVPPQSFVYLN